MRIPCLHSSPSNLQHSKITNILDTRNGTPYHYGAIRSFLSSPSVPPISCVPTRADDADLAFPRAELCCIVEQTATCEPFHHPVTMHRATPQLTVSRSSPVRAIPRISLSMYTEPNPAAFDEATRHKEALPGTISCYTLKHSAASTQLGGRRSQLRQ